MGASLNQMIYSVASILLSRNQRVVFVDFVPFVSLVRNLSFVTSPLRTVAFLTKSTKATKLTNYLNPKLWLCLVRPLVTRNVFFAASTETETRCASSGCSSRLAINSAGAFCSALAWTLRCS